MVLSLFLLHIYLSSDFVSHATNKPGLGLLLRSGKGKNNYYKVCDALGSKLLRFELESGPKRNARETILSFRKVLCQHWPSAELWYQPLNNKPLNKGITPFTPRVMKQLLCLVKGPYGEDVVVVRVMVTKLVVCCCSKLQW